MTLSLDHARELLAPGPAPKSATWALRVAVFSAGALVIGLFMHRLFSLPTPVALNLIKLSILGALVAMLLGVVAVFRIWRTGCGGVGLVFIAGLVSLGLIGWPLVNLPAFNRLPEINDLSTDLDNPPMFDVLAAARPPGANSLTYPGETFSSKQREAYPDLQSLWVNRSSAEAFEIAKDALERKGLRLVKATPPGRGISRPGRIEATDTTLILGFTDDVVVRIIGNSQSARIDLRSASRYGRHDLGQNAQRIRRLLVAINGRLEATVATPGEDRPR